MTKIFEKRKNFDLRRLLAGSERLIDHLLIKDNTRKSDTNTISCKQSIIVFIMSHKITNLSCSQFRINLLYL